MSSDDGRSSPYAFWAFYTLYKRLNGTAAAAKVSFDEVCEKLYPDYPVDPSSNTSLFVTWKKKSRGSSEYHLRGCIGTFAQLPVVKGIERYSLIAALHDRRFSPISAAELNHLKCSCNILHNFETIYDGKGDIYDWQVGTHGIELEFRNPLTGRTLSSTFLPEVMPEQGWDQRETFLNLIEKAGVSTGVCGPAALLQDYEHYFVKVIRYEGRKSAITFEEFEEKLAELEA
ncbi:hypothetical protein HG536_0D01560 [Torulaspora globosa]|uniref:AMMECR1 domain-containing protein n=1 Tax=Torulaspora globosa TaxID=48254 RepID=A0A7G3ZGJ8_9SACH|nr:uncharacterized protein HG536_0D01560 [Torulaspora globosa]QLL32634.1 hypothetical protein HG536_0D01560 [Torulaspora globosa]